LARDGLEGSFAAFGLQGWFVGVANVPEGEGMGAMACSDTLCILSFKKQSPASAGFGFCY